MDIKDRVKDWINDQLGNKADPKIVDQYIDYADQGVWSCDVWQFGLSLGHLEEPRDLAVCDYIKKQNKLLTKNYPMATRDAEMQSSDGRGAPNLSQRSF